ncbi:MAG: ABC transporter permease [Firmicutes bacterium]|nr:ABC transporter permease [Bacillota bacterium]
MRASTGRDSPRLFLLSLLFALALWAGAAAVVGREVILPGPVAVFRLFGRLFYRGETWVHLGMTLFRGVLGFLLSYLAGLFIGLPCGLSRRFDAFFRPFLVGLRSTPTMALILLALIWFRADAVAVFVTFLAVFPLVVQNVTDGVRSIDPALLEMARVYRLRRGKLYRRVYLPAILPYLLAAAASGLGLTWKVIVAAEVLAAPRWGVGTRMDRARVFLATPEVLAWTILVVAVGLFFDRVLETTVRRRFFPWE